MKAIKRNDRIARLTIVAMLGLAGIIAVYLMVKA